MSFEERNCVIYLCVSVLVALIFGTQIYAGTVAGDFDIAGGLQIWARRVLWMIPLAIGLTIVSVIVGQIMYGIVTRDGDLDTQSDERDHRVGMQGMRVTMVVFSGAWIGAMILLAYGYTAIAALNLMLFGGWLSDVFGNLTKLLFYRRGA